MKVVMKKRFVKKGLGPKSVASLGLLRKLLRNQKFHLKCRLHKCELQPLVAMPAQPATESLD